MTISVGHALDALAARQDGVIARAQARRLGLTDDQIDRRLATGRWRVLHRGVYATGPAPLTPRGRALAAVLGAGPEAVLSHRSAAALWGLQPDHPRPPHTTGGVCRAARRGIAVHRTRRWEPGMRTVRRGVPVTTLARTVVDLAELGGADEVERAIRSAERLHGFDRGLVVPIPGRMGARRLVPPPRFTRGHLEPMLVPVLERHGLSLPEFNAPWGGFELDAVWWPDGIVLEIDDWESHRHRDAFIRDRRRSRLLQAAGYRAIQATYLDLTVDADRFAAELRDLGVTPAAQGG